MNEQERKYGIDLGFGPGSTANDPEMTHEEMIERQNRRLEEIYKRLPQWRPKENK
jgi:hypothetical protein